MGFPWWGSALLGRLDYFAVRRVEVVGAGNMSPGQVVSALGLVTGASVWDDLGCLERRLAAVRGVETARVSRRLPGTLRVELSEVEPVALVAGAHGLVPVARDGGPLPYDPARVPVDAPLVDGVEPELTDALGTVQMTSPALFIEISVARRGGKDEIVLELDAGRVLLKMPVDAGVVRDVAAARRDLAARGMVWSELDGRFHGWVIVRPERPVGPRGHATGGRT